MALDSQLLIPVVKEIRSTGQFDLAEAVNKTNELYRWFIGQFPKKTSGEVVQTERHIVDSTPPLNTVQAQAIRKRFQLARNTPL